MPRACRWLDGAGAGRQHAVDNDHMEKANGESMCSSMAWFSAHLARQPFWVDAACRLTAAVQPLQSCLSTRAGPRACKGPGLHALSSSTCDHASSHMPSAVEHMGRPLRTQRSVGGEGHTWAGVPGPCGLSLRTGMAGLAWGGEYRRPPRGSLSTKLARAAFWAARSSRLVVAASPW